MLKYIITILLLLLLLISCSKKEENKDQNEDETILKDADTTALVTEAADNPDELFLMSYKFEKGKSFRYKMTVNSNSRQTMVADSSITQNLNQTMTYLFNFNPVEVDPEGIAELECTVKSVKIDINSNGEKISYHSGKADSSDRMKFAEYESYINNPFHLRVTPGGIILEIFKADKIVNTFLTLKQISDSLNANEKMEIRDDLVKNILKPIIAQIIREFPNHKIAKDSIWSYPKTTLPVLIFQVHLQNQYKVENLEMLNAEKLVVIGGSMSSRVEGDTKYSEQGINYVFEKPVSSGGGKIYFNLSKGLVQRSETQTSMENSFIMEMPSPQGMRKGSRQEIVTNKTILELL